MPLWQLPANTFDLVDIPARFQLYWPYAPSILTTYFRNNDCEYNVDTPPLATRPQRTDLSLCRHTGTEPVSLAEEQKEPTMTQVAFPSTPEPPATPTLNEERFIRLAEVLATCGKSRSSVYEGIKDGTFPAPVKLKGRSSAWLKSEILHWMQACVAARLPVPVAIQATSMKTVTANGLSTRTRRQRA
ncbi:transcriptional regulator, AlpA family [Janthinobacterium sp. 344]|nr:transcriptional regulator, AlpA family [Janthinobacterium sp. 551a]SFB57717.1 transcriptional regulator, AlpA family [Janthinobacterium sp. 344]